MCELSDLKSRLNAAISVGASSVPPPKKQVLPLYPEGLPAIGPPTVALLQLCVH